MSRRKKFWSLRTFWRLRYRVYALIVMLVLMPVMYASGSSVPPKADVIGYDVLEDNFLYQRIAKSKPQVARLPSTGQTPPTPVAQDQAIVDKTGQALTDELKDAGYDMGFISSQAFVDLGIIPKQNQQQATIPVDDAPKREVLDDIVQRPANPQRVNFLRYPVYNINAPIIYTSLEDLFNLKPNCDKNTDPLGCVDVTSPRDGSDVNSPIQRKLQDGIVHLAFTPMPGEIGNSYIVGHSSNFSYIKSAYNDIFKKLEKQSKPGEEFFIYDQYGRELKFRVFETLEIVESDTAEAYKNYPGKRVVTLQTSILEFVPGQGWKPTKRWLTRAELVI